MIIIAIAREIGYNYLKAIFEDPGNTAIHTAGILWAVRSKLN